jgi:hypothetical protein
MGLRGIGLGAGVLVATAAAVVALAVPAAAIPVGGGPGPCASTTTASLAVSRPTLWLGDTTTVSWSISPGPGCAPTVVRLLFRDATTGTVTDTGVRGTAGSAVLAPQSSGSYSLRAVINGWIADFGSESVAVGVPEVDGRPTVEITRPDQKALFAQVVGLPDALVRIAGDVELDLSYMDNIHVAPGVEIIGERTQNPRGPRLFTTTFPRALLDVGVAGDTDPTHASDNVRITGVRFDGGESSDPCDSAGSEDSDAIAVFSSQNVRIDHDEMYRWRGAAVVVYDPAGRVNKENASTVRVDDNWIHDNQHPGYCGPNPFGSGHGGGYGVSVNQGGFALIERNAFDQNRHSITGHGSTGDGYLLRGNIFLRPGVDSVKLGLTHYNHQIDMHGLETCGSGEHWNCGQAGDFMEVARNTVVFPTSDAIQLRGTPTDPRGMSVFGNVFSQRREKALTQTESGLHEDGGNVFGPYDANHPGILNPGDSDSPCDFDRDGVGDGFWATGATWWYLSSLTGHLVFLNRSTHGTNGAHTLSDANGDGRCDVTTDQGTFLTPPDAPFDLIRPGDQTTSAGTPAALQLSRPGGGALWWAATGLPDGLHLDAATGRLSGSPNSPGTYAVLIGASDAHGDTVYDHLTWTVTPSFREVPDIVGSTVSQASAALTAAGLQLGSRTVKCGPLGQVMNQNPAAGSAVPAGTSVRVTVGGHPSGGHSCE